MGFRKSAPAPIMVAKQDRTSSYSSQYSARSDSSTGSDNGAAASSSSPSSPPIPRRNMNVYTHCGRHTNQFLFGGHSLTDMARSVFKRDE